MSSDNATSDGTTKRVAPDNGGPAFPVTMSGEPQFDCATSLRDYFAAKVISRLLPMGVTPLRQYREGAPETVGEVAAMQAYHVADAMLAERRKTTLAR